MRIEFRPLKEYFDDRKAYFYLHWNFLLIPIDELHLLSFGWKDNHNGVTANPR